MTKKTKEELLKELEVLKERLNKLENADLEQKKVIEALSESVAKYRLLFDAAPVGIGIADLEGNIIDANRNMQEMSGYSLDEYRAIDVGATYADPEERKILIKALREKGTVRDWGGRLKRKDGSQYQALLNADIMELDGRKVVLGIIRDISEQKRIELALNAALTNAQDEKNKSEAIIAALGDGIIIQDTDYKIIYQNQVQNDIYGDKTGELCYRAYEGRDEICDDCPVERTFRDGKIHRSEKKVPTDNGDLYFELTSSPLKDSSGKIIAGIKIVRDITQRKRNEESLKLFSEAVESAPDGIQIVDPGGQIKYSNKAVEKIYGFSHDELIGKNVGELNVDPEIAGKAIIPGIIEKGFWAGELIVRHKDSHEFPIWLRTSLVRDETGVPIAMVGIIRDMTERQKVEKAMLESETRYRTLFESASDAIFILEAEGDEAGRIIAANQTAARMHGYSLDELLMLNIDDLDTRESSQDAQDYTQRILNGETVKAELDHLRKDGTVFPVEIGAGLLELGDHKYILAFDRDITERKHAQEALRLSNLVVENSQTVLFRWKPQEGWPVEFVSNNVIQFGYSAQDFLSGALLYASIIYSDDLERVSDEVHKHSERNNYRFRQEYRIIAKNGAVHWIDDRTVIERNKDGQITNYQGIIIDITERKHAEEAIRKYNIELEESNRMKELFIDIMHHDLLNPLNVANGYVELFLEDEINQKKISYLETIKRNLVKGIELIDNAMKFSKLESMKNIEFEDLDLKKLVTEVIENLSPLAAKAKIRIENRLKGKMTASANTIFEDIFANLISNAIKYAPHGKKIVVDGKDRNSSWMIRVVDFGPGIKDADKKLVFERFQRGDKKGVKGSGLGLAIARKIVELHNGRIWVEDNPEGGAVFVVDIPKSTS